MRSERVYIWMTKQCTAISTNANRMSAKLSALLKARQSHDSNLRKQLVWHMCLGDDKLLGDIYPVLVLSKPAKLTNSQFVNENLQFISAVKWKAIFDFDDDAI